MALTRSQYQAILRKYEEKQLNAQRIRSMRQEEIEEKLPAYAELNHKIAETAKNSLHLLFEEQLSDTMGPKEMIRRFSAEKQKLLTDAGYPADYLDLHYTCPDCQDTGYIEGRKCHCFLKEEMRILYEQSHIQELLETENFDVLSYEYYKDEDLLHFENTVALSKKFVNEFKNNYQNLFFYGTVGTGKSFLSGCIAKEVLEMGCSVIYFSASGLFDSLARYTFDYKQKENLTGFYDDIYHCDLIIIDDLGTEVTNSFVTSQLFALINERHLCQKATIISTNLNLEELRDRYSDRVFSRITSNYTLCKMTGPDIRMMKKISRK